MRRTTAVTMAAGLCAVASCLAGCPAAVAPVQDDAGTPLADAGPGSDAPARDARVVPLDAPADGGPVDCDVDGDGFEALGCGGNDCDDGDALRYPGNLERCDGLLGDGRAAADHDEDCDPCSISRVGIVDGDADADLYPRSECRNPWLGAVAPIGCDPNTTALDATLRVVSGSDCNDDTATGGAAIHPGLGEECDDADNDCDGDTDEDNGLGMSCECLTGTNEACGPTDTAGTFVETGECAVGSRACESGRWLACAGAVYEASETCNSRDDDCDGRSDEALHVFTRTRTWTAGCGGELLYTQVSCAVDTSAFCAANPPPAGVPACQGVAGFMTDLYATSSSYEIACLSGLAAPVVVNSERIFEDTGVRCYSNSLGGCNAAVHRYCVMRGYVSGFLTDFSPTLPIGEDVRMRCVTAAQATIILRPAADRHSIGQRCRDAGFATGFGPVENDGTTIAIACVPSY